MVRDALARPGFRRPLPQGLQDRDHAPLFAHDRRGALCSVISVFLLDILRLRAFFVMYYHLDASHALVPNHGGHFEYPY